MLPRSCILVICTLLHLSLYIACMDPSRISYASGEDLNVPNTILVDGNDLASAKRRLLAGDTLCRHSLAILLQQAKEALKIPPHAVTEKQKIPPGGDKHDFMSLGPYWWPNPDTPDGLPYIRKDGEKNPEIYAIPDDQYMSDMVQASVTLSLAYYFTDDEQYATHAIRLIDTWFLDDSTRMNPHLEYAQAIPGITIGRDIGIIDSWRFTELMDALVLLQPAEHWSETQEADIHAWFCDYLTWLLESEHGKSEGNRHNNHGTWYDAQVSALALFTGQPGIARTTLDSCKIKRMDAHLAADGSQPEELVRTKAFSYSVFNLKALFYLACMAEKVDIDLWHYQNKAGAGLQETVDFLLPYALKQKEWPYQQIAPFPWRDFTEVLQMAARKYGQANYLTAVDTLIHTYGIKTYDNLLYPVAIKPGKKL